MATTKLNKDLSNRQIRRNNSCVYHPEFSEGRNCFIFITDANEYNEPKVTIYERNSMQTTELNLNDLRWLVSELEKTIVK